MIIRRLRISWLCTAVGFGAGVLFGKNYETLSVKYFPSALGHQVYAAEVARQDLLPVLPADVVLPSKISSPDTVISPPSRVSQIMRFGYPGFETLRTYEDFVLSYDRRNRIANWVIEHLTPEGIDFGPNVDRKKSSFAPDPSIHPFFRSTLEDYKKSGYDRGHLAAAANHPKTQNAIDQTFLLSNMAPQVGVKFNQGKWNDLEKHVRALTRKNRNVYVCTGPLYIPRRELDGKLYVKYEVIGKNNVAVPTHFFKVILVDTIEGHLNVESYVMPNTQIEDNTPLKAFQVPIETIERAAGFLIFENVPRSQLKLINGKQVS